MTCCPCLPSPLGASSPAEPMVAVPSNLKASLGPSSGAKNLRLNKDEERDAGLGPYTRESSLIGKNGKAGWVLLLLSHSWDSGVTAGHAVSGSGAGGPWRGAHLLQASETTKDKHEVLGGWRGLGTGAQGGQNNGCVLACCPLRTQFWTNNPRVMVSPGLLRPPPPCPWLLCQEALLLQPRVGSNPWY